MTQRLPDECADCGRPGREGRSLRCPACRKAHRTRSQTQAQAHRRASKKPQPIEARPVAAPTAKRPDRRIANALTIVGDMARQAAMARAQHRGITVDVYDADIQALYNALT